MVRQFLVPLTLFSAGLFGWIAFSTRNPAGTEVAKSEELSRQVTLVDFSRLVERQPTVLFLFATWCKFSAYEARYAVPQFAAYVARHGGHVVGIDETPFIGIGRPGPRGRPDLGLDSLRQPREEGVDVGQALASYRRIFHLALPLVADPEMRVGSQLPLYFYGAYPTFVFVSRDGHVITRAVGIQSPMSLESTFNDVASVDKRTGRLGI